MNTQALIPGIITRARRAGIEMLSADAEKLAVEMLKFECFEGRLTFLDEQLSKLYNEYALHLFLTKRPDYRVTVNG